ncbi:MAG: nucleoside hydrolase [Candidatus Zipacnadales bacterium]
MSGYRLMLHCSLSVLIAPAFMMTVLGAQPMQFHKIIYDTDIGSDIDDAFALALALQCPELELLAVTTVHDSSAQRARICCKMLPLMGRDAVPVACGAGESDPNQAPWAEGFEAKQPVETPAAQLIVDLINQYPGEVTLVPVGPLTNIAAALKLDPELPKKVKRMVTMGGAAYVGYNCQPPPVVEYNIGADISAAQAVYASGMPIIMCGLDVTVMLQFDAAKRAQLAARGLPLTNALQALYELWPYETPTLFDPMAICMTIDESFCTVQRRCVVVDDEGMTRVVEGGEPTVGVCIAPDVERFFRFYIERVIQPE